MNDSLLYTWPHRRFNPLNGEWLLVSPQRATRPWQGQVEPVSSADIPAYDPHCYLCPGNQRANGITNPAYRSTFVFENDFRALVPEPPPSPFPCTHPLLCAEEERGICRVVCYSPRHDLTLAGMSSAEICEVVDVWGEQYEELGGLEWVRHVQIFENRGAQMGASNPHPHGQIWAQASLPNEPAKELAQQRSYLTQHDRCLLCDYAALEIERGERLVYMNATFVVVVPFWAVWPFETLILPRRHHGAISDLDATERMGLAEVLHQLTRRYDALFGVPFPYSMGFHQRPTDGADYPEWHLHAHVYPPLLRSASIRKFMVGYEMLAQAQRDMTAEEAAWRLRG
ncbi:galactose-1-phosphate uridylyltransferase [Oscillochloris trichoides DG-6]|uniref:Galactose-1-phosphate uridylyltransferase n=1 Tax=Oscillochloris trichoides DG-6 TaxID=765420 RepID=E1ID37_9CHLR|nr:UDP-glucose--hexose-1-phosphate uridylyltransferase [Oscillochloris trichoides]EFO80908.1 galactose-1-phosphate uridylyltransferase [Oscillochloris trichoides DG-6]